MVIWGLIFVLITSPGAQCDLRGAGCVGVPVGDTFCDAREAGCWGEVNNSYYIGETEITNGQYAEFLNSIAAVSDPMGLWNPLMAGTCYPTIPTACGRIFRTEGINGFSYIVQTGYENYPVNLVSAFDAMRFVNWLNNGKPTGPQSEFTTESGSYTFTGPSQVGPRNGNALFWLPSDSEWYKAAYFNPQTNSWQDFPVNSEPHSEWPPGDSSSANCGFNPVKNLTIVGNYNLAISPWGTKDQAGNVFEWTDTLRNILFVESASRGGTWAKPCYLSSAGGPSWADATFEGYSYGFRVAASLPEPGSLTGLFMGTILILVLNRRYNARTKNDSRRD